MPVNCVVLRRVVQGADRSGTSSINHYRNRKWRLNSPLAWPEGRFNFHLIIFNMLCPELSIPEIQKATHIKAPFDQTGVSLASKLSNKKIRQVLQKN
jgi:hypothetical protein